MTITGFPAGEYILIVEESPAGYTAPGNILFVVADGTAEQEVGVQLVSETAVDALVRLIIEILIRILSTV